MAIDDQTSPKIDLFKLPYPVLRTFINVLPVEGLVAFRRTCRSAQRLSKFRGKVVEYLTVSGKVPNRPPAEKTLRVSYDDLLKLRTVVIPTKNVTLAFDGPIDTEILALIIERTYTTLTVYGEYGWEQVLPLIHNGLESITLYGIMMMAGRDASKFFGHFKSFTKLKLRVACNNTLDSWINPARNAIYTNPQIDYDETINDDGYMICTKFKSLDKDHEIDMLFLTHVENN